MDKKMKLLTTKYKHMLLIIGYGLSITIASIVYLTGGTYNVYANLMYLSIAIVSSSNSTKHAVVHALFSGLIIGPFMPLIVEDAVMQETINWTIRCAVYASSSILIGFYNSKITQEEERINDQNYELFIAQKSTLNSLVQITETKDVDTGGHIDRIVDLTRLLLMECAKEKELKSYMKQLDIETLASASALHDIGKVAIPESVLNKPGKLSIEEFKLMKTHTVKGAKALQSVKEEYPNNAFINAGYEITLYHHEWYDGSGYPKGLKNEEIPFSARVVSIIDVYDALRSERPYKQGFSHSETMRIMDHESRKHFDPFLYRVFKEKHFKFDMLYSELD